MTVLAGKPDRTGQVVDPPRARDRRRLDPLVVFQIYLVLLVFSPAIYVIKPLGAAGTPATVFGCLVLLLWIVGRLSSSRERIGLTPVHWMALAYSAAMVLSFVGGMLRPISAEEVSSSLRGLISLAGGMGVILYAADTMRTRAALSSLLRFAVLMGACLAAMGILQFFTGLDVVSLLHLPGLQANSDIGGLYVRAGFRRISGTATHSIEFAAVLGMLLPLAAHYALNAANRRWWAWAQFIVILGALPLTVARSGAIALLLGVLFALLIASTSQRLKFLLIAPIAALVFRLFVPGLYGAIGNLFADAGSDNSISGRTQDFQAVEAFFAQSPLIGRGLNTFIPSIYRTLDNQYLATAVEAGLIGALALIAFFGVPFVASLIAGSGARDRFVQTQAFAIAAGIACAAILAATFDFFSFPMAFGTLCLLVGAAGGAWRVHRAEAALAPGGRPTVAAPKPPALLPRWAIVLGAVAAGLAVFAACFLASRRAEGVFEARESVVPQVDPPKSTNAFDTRIDTDGLSVVLKYRMDGQQVHDELAAAGVDYYAVAVGSGSLAPYTDVLGYGDLMQLAARGVTVDEAKEKLITLRTTLQQQLDALQGPATNPDLHIRLEDSFSSIEVFSVPVSRTSAIAGGAVLGGFVAALAALLLAVPRQRPTRPAPKKKGAAFRLTSVWENG
ncbi:O-antigen ligase family protein [Leifsonia sp. ZF2019]|uniref:O-antigen ligase family protein n=1 Tax=Leifsonia sp. ZF2019 TaxID=2781978 RepID=UPI001CBBEF7D|nr:O-antigen ligase family protein [Leifsonia sp. ZF2019]UAJ78972.1 O-antigen ligase family protein [Leifsonia sp. ZF2019]